MSVGHDGLAQLLAKEEITDALVRYCRGVDRRDAELVRSAYHEDATDDHGYTVVKTGWDIAELADRDNRHGFPAEWISTSHVLTNILVRTDGNTASSESYYTATQRFKRGDERYELIATGRYVDQWERRGGSTFKITSRVVITDDIQTRPVPYTWPGPDHDVPKAFWAAPSMPVPAAVPLGTSTTDDVSYQAIPELR